MSVPKAVGSGRFQIYDPIGAGGVATVFQAYDRDKNEMIALKLMNEDSVGNDKRRRRFLSEAETLQALDHPHIVPVRAVGDHNGRLWIAMQLMGGGSAGRLLKRGGPQPAVKALDIAHKVLLGLEAAHALGVVHRDVKPQNILIGDDGAVKLCDFGIARQDKPEAEAEAEAEEGDAALTQMFDRLGSIIYMAPEQRADPRDVSATTDVYAIGATLYALLAGRRPPDLSRAPIRPQMLDPIAPPLRPILLKACALDRTQRFASARAMADEVERLLNDAKTNARWYESPTTGRRQKRPKNDEFAQWPTREEAPAAPEPEASPMARPMFKPKTPPGGIETGVTAPAGPGRVVSRTMEPAAPRAPQGGLPGKVVSRRTPAAPARRTATPVPRSNRLPPQEEGGLPKWVLGLLVALGGFVVFVFAVAGGLVALYLVTQGT